MPPWMDLLGQLSDLSTLPAFLGLVVTASVIAMVRDWRFALWALLVQYILVGILHLRMLSPELALIKAFVGLLICPMLYWAARWVESERVHKELQIAGEIQQRLLPKEIIPIPQYEIAAAAQPCTSVGGDFYDVISLGANKYAFVMADVTGKGVPAALLVSTLHASLRAYIQSDTNLSELTAKLNNLVYANSPSERFITFFIMVLDCEKHTLTYVNAGHNFPYLLRRQSQEIIELEASGLPLGMIDNVNYESKEINLEHDDVLALYTDGVTEAMDKAKQQYSEERLKAMLKKSLVDPAMQIRDQVLEDVRKFIGQEPPSDDLTLLVLKHI